MGYVEHIVENGKYFLYRHIRKDKNEPFYIGVGTKSAYGNLYKRATDISPKRRNFIWSGIASRTEIEVEILLETDDIDFIMKKEEEFISLYGRLCSNNGTLVNIDKGGYRDRTFRRDNWRKSASERMAKMNVDNAKNRIGKNNINKLSRPVYVYTLEGDFLYGFYTGAQAADYFGEKNKNLIIKKLDTGKSYKNYFFSSKAVERLNTSNFIIADESKHYPKKVAKIDDNFNQLSVYENLISAAKSIGYSPGALGVSIRKNKSTRKGKFIYISDGNN